jgi:integrase
MAEKRVHVWVQHFADRPHLMLQWLDPDTGKRKSKSAETCNPKEAEHRRADLESDLNNGRYTAASGMTWEHFRDLFEAEYLPGLRASSQSRYREVLDLFERLCNPRTLAGVNERTLSALKVAMRKEKVKGREGYAPASIRHALVIVSAALEWAAGQRIISRVPRTEAVKVPRKRPRPIPAESFERLLGKAPDRQTRAYLLAGWLAGLRLAEAYTLEWEPSDKWPWVDLSRDRVWLPAEFVKAVEDQWVPLDPVLREALEALPRRGRKVFHFADAAGRPISPGGVSKRVRDLARRAGVKLSMHTLRKGFGCRYAGKVPAQVLQKLMRHANIKTTMDFYANVDAAVEEAVLGKRAEERTAPHVAQEDEAELRRADLEAVLNSSIRNRMCNNPPPAAPQPSPGAVPAEEPNP